MTDLIKREDTIKGKKAQTLNANAEFMMGRFCNEDESRIYNIGFAEGWNAHIERCKDIPAVEPKQGTYRDSGEDDEWYGHWAICNECGAEWMGDENFCPNCGAKLQEETNQ